MASTDKYHVTINIKDAETLLDKCSRLHTEWSGKEATSTDLDLFTKVYGGPRKTMPFTSPKQVCAMLGKVLKMVNECVPTVEKKESQTAILVPD